MGVLSTLGQINERVEDTTDAVLDNERFSLQDNVRAAHMRTLGYDESEEDEYARAVNRDYDAATDAITDRAGELTDNQTLAGAGRGADSFFDMMVGYPLKAAYGSVTGVDTMTNNPDHADTDYSPDALDTLEVGVTASGAGTVGKVGVKGASRVARASRAADTNMLGGLTRFGRRLLGKGDNVARSADDVSTSVNTRYRKIGSSVDETVKIPDEKLTTRLATSAQDTTTAASGGGLSLSQKLIGGAGLGAITLGAAGVIGGPTTYPDGYRVDKTYNGQPPADRVKQSDSDGNTKGFWVVVKADGKTVRYLRSGGGTSTTTFPASRPPPFSDRGQADAAYERWRSEIRNESSDSSTYREGKQAASGEWGDVKTVNTLGSGWVLYRQEHKQEDDTRYIVAGRDANGEVLFLSKSGSVTRRVSVHPDRQSAMDAFRVWSQAAEKGNAARPDRGADRVGEDELLRMTNRTGPGSGGSGILRLVALGGGAAVIIALLVGVFM